MKLSEYASTAKGAILILGEPGSGKTVLSTQLFPNGYLLEADNNLKGPLDYIKRCDLTTQLDVDIPHLDEKGQVVPREGRFRRYANLGNAALVNPAYDTIINDSLTSIADYCMDEVRVQQGRKIADGVKNFKDDAMQIQDWGPFAGLLKHLIITQKASGKRTVWLAHLDTREDESREGSKTLMKYINVPGQSRQTIAGYFDEVWLLATEMRNGKPVRVLYTSPEDFRSAPLGLKTATGLGLKFDVDFEKLRKEIA